MMRFGIGAFTGQVPTGDSRTFPEIYESELELIRIAEENGFESAWVAEHHFTRVGWFSSPLTFLAGAATRTKRIRLGTAVALLPFDNPIRLAEEAATVDILSNGRLVLGVGLGVRDEEFKGFGVPRRERVGRLEESVEILRKAWTGERFSYKGRYYEVNDVTVTPPPARKPHPPLYFGAYAPKAVERAARLGDGFLLPSSLTLAKESFAARMAIIDRVLEERKLNRKDFEIVFMTQGYVSSTGDAWEQMKPGFIYWERLLKSFMDSEKGDFDKGSYEKEIDERTADTFRESVVSGTPSEIVEQVEKFRDMLGGDYTFVIKLWYPNIDFKTTVKAVELFGNEVIARFA